MHWIWGLWLIISAIQLVFLYVLSCGSIVYLVVAKMFILHGHFLFFVSMLLYILYLYMDPQCTNNMYPNS